MYPPTKLSKYNETILIHRHLQEHKRKILNKHLTKFRAPLVMLGGELNTTVLRSLQLIKDKLLLLMA